MAICNCDTKIYAQGLCKNCYMKEWRKNNKEHYKNYRKQYRNLNIEKIKQLKHTYYINNKEKICEKVSEYQKTKMGKLVMNRKREKRRLKKQLLIETYTTKDWINILTQTKGICPRCKINVGINNLELDHIIPISKAYPFDIYTIQNIQPLCKMCNSKKSNKIEVKKEWQKYLL